METTAAVDHLVRRAALLGIDLTRLDAGAAVELVLGWFEEERADDALPVDEEGDGVLFQWGTYDFGQGPTFRFDLTRQFTVDDEGERVLSQLSLTLHYPPNRQTAVLGDNSEWCFDPVDIPLLRQVIAGAPATEYVSGRPPEKVTLTYCPAD